MGLLNFILDILKEMRYLKQSKDQIVPRAESLLGVIAE